MPAPKPQSALGSAKWVEERIAAFDLKTPPPSDERMRRAVVQRFSELDLALREGALDASAVPTVRAFRRRFYEWLLRRPDRGATGWSLADLEASPLLNAAELRQWSQLDDVVRARFMLQQMRGKAGALFELLRAAATPPLKVRTFQP